MEKKFTSLVAIKSIKQTLFLLASLSVISCAQGQEHTSNERWLTEQKLAEKTIVLLNNEAGTLPLANLEKLKICSINLGAVNSGVFDSLLNKYQNVGNLDGRNYTSAVTLNGLTDDAKLFNTLIVQVPAIAASDSRLPLFIAGLEKKFTVILSVFGDGQALKNFENTKSPIVWCSQNTPAAAAIAAQAIFGGLAVDNKLDRSFSSKYKTGSGFSITKTRLTYTVPELVNINSDDLKKIDDIAAEAIREKAAPAIVVMVIKDGNVIYNKAYGSPTYGNLRPTRITDIFDLASVTKVSATTQAVMKLTESKSLNLDSTLQYYLARTRTTDKKDVKVREVMLHQAGFVPYIPFYQKLTKADYRTDYSPTFPTKVADNYYLRKDYYEDVMWPQMLNTKLVSRGKYVYSDLSMYYMQQIVESVTHTPLQDYVLNEFYAPLGMQTAGFLPRNRFDRDLIIPTEDDLTFRKTLLQGYVHDQGAAMAGGVAGHAGLFASANDLGILYQMLLNRGTYGGRQYFKPETVDMFTAKQSDVSRRGLGFDRWDPELSKHYPSEFASPKTFGHTGYTGTCVWVDPEYNLVYIFLSNRVNPQVSDKLSFLSIRPRIQDAIYEAIKKSVK